MAMEMEMDSLWIHAKWLSFCNANSAFIHPFQALTNEKFFLHDFLLVLCHTREEDENALHKHETRAKCDEKNGPLFT